MGITGEKNIFCAGLNLKKVPFYTQIKPKEMILSFNRLIFEIYGMPIPTIAAINGHTIAGGLILAIACDYSAVDTDFKIGFTEAKVGIPFPLSAMELAKGEINKAFFRRMILSADNIDKNKAIKENIIDELCPKILLEQKSFEKALKFSLMPKNLINK